MSLFGFLFGDKLNNEMARSHDDLLFACRLLQRQGVLYTNKKAIGAPRDATTIEELRSICTRSMRLDDRTRIGVEHATRIVRTYISIISWRGEVEDTARIPDIIHELEDLESTYHEQICLLRDDALLFDAARKDRYLVLLKKEGEILFRIKGDTEQEEKLILSIIDRRRWWLRQRRGARTLYHAYNIRLDDPSALLRGGHLDASKAREGFFMTETLIAARRIITTIKSIDPGEVAVLRVHIAPSVFPGIVQQQQFGQTQYDSGEHYYIPTDKYDSANHAIDRQLLWFT